VMAFRRSIYEEGGTDSDLDLGHDAFLMAQGKSSLGGNTEQRSKLCVCLLTPLSLETYKNLVFLWLVNCPFGFFTFLVTFVLVGISLGFLPLCVGLILLAGTQFIADKFGQAEVWLLNLFYKNSRGRVFRPTGVQPYDDGIFHWTKAHLLSLQSWKDLIYFNFFKFIVSFFSAVTSFLTVGISLGFTLSLVIFFTCDNCIKNGTLCMGSFQFPGKYGTDWMKEWTNGTCESGWHIYRVQDCVGLTILGLPLLYGALLLSNALAAANYKLAVCFLSDPDMHGNESLLGYDPKAGMFSSGSNTAPNLVDSVRERQKGRKASLESDKPPKSGGSSYLPEFGDTED